jgi:hypothetical protein
MARVNWLVNGVFLLGIVICFLRFAPDGFFWSHDISVGNGLVSRIEAFQTEHGFLPADLSVVGASHATQDKYFYQACDDKSFIVWFGTALGKSMTFESATGSWTSIHPVCRFIPYG